MIIGDSDGSLFQDHGVFYRDSVLHPDNTFALCLIDLCLRGYESCSIKLTIDQAEAQFLGLQTISR